MDGWMDGCVRNSAHITRYYSNTPLLDIIQLAGLRVGSAGSLLTVSVSQHTFHNHCKIDTVSQMLGQYRQSQQSSCYKFKFIKPRVLANL